MVRPRNAPLLSDRADNGKRLRGAAGCVVSRHMHLTRLPGTYAIARAAADAPVPAGVLDGPGFVSVSRTADELSVVALADQIAGMERVDTGWTVFKLQGPFAFDVVGVVAALSRPIAEAGIGIFVVSTFDTDYLLVKAENAARAAEVWRRDGHVVD